MPHTIEKRVSNLEEMVGDIPRLLDIRFEAVHARFQALEAKVDALPRILAEMLTEMLDERERRKS